MAFFTPGQNGYGPPTMSLLPYTHAPTPSYSTTTTALPFSHQPFWVLFQTFNALPPVCYISSRSSPRISLKQKNKKSIHTASNIQHTAYHSVERGLNDTTHTQHTIYTAQHCIQNINRVEWNNIHTALYIHRTAFYTNTGQCTCNGRYVLYTSQTFYQSRSQNVLSFVHNNLFVVWSLKKFIITSEKVQFSFQEEVGM